MTATLQIRNNQYIVILRWQENAKQKRKSISTGLPVKGNKRRAEEMMTELMMEWEEELKKKNSPASIMFDQFLLLWLEKTKATIKATTYASYKNTLEKVVVPYFKPLQIPLCDLKPYHLQDFYDSRLKDGVSANTIRHYNANIHKALKYAYKQEYIQSNPADKVELPKVERFIGGCYTQQNVDALFSAVIGTKLEIPVIIAAFMGMRLGEICGLKWEFVDFERQTIKVAGVVTDKGEESKQKNLAYRSSAKTSKSIRTLPMPDVLSNYLRRLKVRQAENKLLCGNSYDKAWDGFVCVDQEGHLIQPQYISWNFPKFLVKHNLPRIRFHDLRHTNASLLIRNGAAMKELQDWLGHASMTTTSDIYAHIFEDSKKALSDSIGSTLHLSTPSAQAR